MPKAAVLEYKAQLRSIRNAALCIMQWAQQEEEEAIERPTSVNWGHVGSADRVLDDLKETCRFLNIKIKEV